MPKTKVKISTLAAKNVSRMGPPPRIFPWQHFCSYE